MNLLWADVLLFHSSHKCHLLSIQALLLNFFVAQLKHFFDTFYDLIWNFLTAFTSFILHSLFVFIKKIINVILFCIWQGGNDMINFSLNQAKQEENKYKKKFYSWINELQGIFMKLFKKANQEILLDFYQCIHTWWSFEIISFF